MRLKKICFIWLFFLFVPAGLAADLKIKSTGVAELNGRFYRCVVGKNGVTSIKTEGDLKTPRGKFPLLWVYYRPDKFPNGIHSRLRQKTLNKTLGWCDDSRSDDYNQAVKLPFPGSYESLWRSDNLYDLILVIDYNQHPIEPGKGSAIFIHVANNHYTPTQGCVAFSKKDLLEILALLDSKSSVIIN